MTTFGAHAFAWTAEWSADGAALALRAAAARGLDFVEIPLPVDLGAFPLERTLELLDETGMAMTTSLVLPRDAHMPSNPARALRLLRRAVELTRTLGGDMLTGVLYANLGTLTRRPPTREEVETCGRTLKEAARVAAGYGVDIGIEAINRYRTYLNNTADQVIAMLERIDEPNVFAHLDTYHMNIEERGFRAPIERLGDRLRYIHLSESDRGTPGLGNVRWDDVFAGLRAIRYDGPLALEAFVEVTDEVVGDTAIWRDVVGDADVLLRDGLAFLRGKCRDYGLVPAAA